MQYELTHLQLQRRCSNRTPRCFKLHGTNVNENIYSWCLVYSWDVFFKVNERLHSHGFWNVSKSSVLAVPLLYLPYQSRQKESWQNMEANFTSCGKRQLAVRPFCAAGPVINQWDYNYNHKELQVRVCTNNKKKNFLMCDFQSFLEPSWLTQSACFPFYPIDRVFIHGGPAYYCQSIVHALENIQ